MEDDEICLSEHTLKALQEFMAEQQQKIDEEQQRVKEGKADIFEEDWQLSQFWYSKETALKIAQEAITISNNGKIACLCTPSVFRRLWEMTPNCEYFLFEFDKRFDTAYGDKFVFYDCNQSTKIPKQLWRTFDVIIIDPPFLSEDCFTKIAVSVKLLSKPDTKWIILTGAIMEPVIMKLFKDLRRCTFVPKHERQLQNDFACFANYASNELDEN